MNNLVRVSLLISNLAYLFVSSIGVKLVLPNFFFLPVCLFECSADYKLLSLILLVAWCYLWAVFFSHKTKRLPFILSQAVLLIHVVILAYDAVQVRSAAVLLTASLIPSYVFVICYTIIAYRFYGIRFQNSR